MVYKASRGMLLSTKQIAYSSKVMCGATCKKKNLCSRSRTQQVEQVFDELQDNDTIKPQQIEEALRELGLHMDARALPVPDHPIPYIKSLPFQVCSMLHPRRTFLHLIDAHTRYVIPYN